MTATPDISALVAELRDVANRVIPARRNRYRRVIDALLALQSENTALRARLEEAEKVIRPFGKPWKPGMPRASRVDFEAAARWLEGK